MDPGQDTRMKNPLVGGWKKKGINKRSRFSILIKRVLNAIEMKKN